MQRLKLKLNSRIYNNSKNNVEFLFLYKKLFMHLLSNTKLDIKRQLKNSAIYTNFYLLKTLTV